MQSGKCTNKNCKKGRLRSVQFLKDEEPFQCKECHQPLVMHTNQKTSVVDWVEMRPRKIDGVKLTLRVSGGTAGLLLFSKGEGKRPLLLIAHGRQRRPASLATMLLGTMYDMGFMVPLGCSLRREYFVTDTDRITYKNVILDYVRTFAEYHGAFTCIAGVPEVWLGPHTTVEIMAAKRVNKEPVTIIHKGPSETISVEQALPDLLDHCDVGVFTELSLVAPQEAPIFNQAYLDAKEYRHRYDDAKVPLFELLRNDELGQRYQAVLVMACRSPWPGPAPADQECGPGFIYSYHDAVKQLVK